MSTACRHIIITNGSQFHFVHTTNRLSATCATTITKWAVVQCVVVWCKPAKRHRNISLQWTEFYSILLFFFWQMFPLCLSKQFRSQLNIPIEWTVILNWNNKSMKWLAQCRAFWWGENTKQLNYNRSDDTFDQCICILMLIVSYKVRANQIYEEKKS